MQSTKYLRYITGAVALSVSCLVFSDSSFAQNKQIERIVVFGSSLSDSGNAFVLLSDPASFGFSQECIGQMGSPANVPPYDALDELLIPDGSYAKGGHHEANGATWIEQFARGKGLSGNVLPALRNPGIQASYYAVGGARASDYPCRFNLADQLDEYQRDFSATSANTLVVLEIGGNDVRDALAGLLAGLPGDPINTATDNIEGAIRTLYGQGARNFLLVNVPAIGKTPAVKILDTLISSSGPVPPGFVVTTANSLAGSFNLKLAQLQVDLNQDSGLSGIDVRTLNLYKLLNEIIEYPASFGIINTDDACVTPNIAPFQCKKPDTYLFWDGIHPTKVVHDIMAQRAAEVLLTPTP